MSSECKFKVIVCPLCSYRWPFTGKARKIQCPGCKKFFDKSEVLDESRIRDDIMKGNILDALGDAGINPDNNHEMFKDVIPLILRDDDLKFAFSKACSELRRSPERLMRSSVRSWLEENGYL